MAPARLCLRHQPLSSMATRITASPPTFDTPKQANARAFLGFTAVLITLYLAWLCVFWPGMLGDDSFAVLLEVDMPGAFRSGKSGFWYYLVRITYGTTGRVETTIALLLCLSALIFARILSWQWQHGHRKACWVFLVLVCAAPHTIYFLSTLYPDGIFAVAACGLLFELWLCAKRGRVSRMSAAMIALTLPFALFARTNGVLFLLPAVLTLCFVNPSGRRVLVIAIASWCALAWAAHHVHKATPQSAALSLALFETANFLRPYAMDDLRKIHPETVDPWLRDRVRLTPRTLDILLTHRSRENILAHEDPAYWDMLVFNPAGPQLLNLPPAQQQELVSEFFRHNLWHNLPVFLGSRSTVFFTAALADGGFPALDYAATVLPRTQAKSSYRAFHLDHAERMLRKIHQTSHEWRWLLWTPFVGLTLMLCLMRQGWRNKDLPGLLLSVSLLAQLAGIFVFSAAGEYRYLLLFFFAPLVVWPALAAPQSSHLTHE